MDIKNLITLRQKGKVLVNIPHGRITHMLQN